MCRLRGSQRVSGCLCTRAAGKGCGRRAAGNNGLDQLAVLGRGRNADGGVKDRADAGTARRRADGNGDGDEDALSGSLVWAGASHGAAWTGGTYQGAIATPLP